MFTMALTPFLNACLLNDYQLVQQCLQTNSSTKNEVYINGENPLHLTASSNNLVLCKLLLKYHMDVNKTSALGVTPLICACQNQSVEIVQELLKIDGVKVNCQDIHGKTALFYAIERESIQIVELFNQETIYWTIDWNLQSSSKLTVSLLSLQLSSNKMLHKLLAINSINWHTIDEEGNNAQMIAVIRNLPEVLYTFLKKFSIDVNDRNKNNDTTAILAIRHRSYQCLEILKSITNVDWGLENNQQESPFSLALQQNDRKLFWFLISQSTYHGNLNKLISKSLQATAFKFTVEYIHENMKNLLTDDSEETSRNATQKSLFKAFVFALKHNYNATIIQLLLERLSNEDLVLLIIGKKKQVTN